jgi:hypothetical protein
MATSKSRPGRDQNVDEDAWFSGELETGEQARARVGSSPRERRLMWGLGLWTLAVALLGLVLGAFGSSTNAAAVDTEKELRALAKGMVGARALEALPLDTHLDRLAQLRKEAGATPGADEAPRPATEAGANAGPSGVPDAGDARGAPGTPGGEARPKGDAPKPDALKPDAPKKEPSRSGDKASAAADVVASAPKAAGADTTATPKTPVDVMKMKIDAVPATPGIPRDPKAAEAKAAEAKAAEAKAATPGDGISAEQALAAAKSLLDGGRWADAKAAYDRVLAQQPGSVSALYGRGSALYQLRQTAAALADMEAVLAIQPKHPTALRLAGAISQATGNTDAARKYYSRYVEAWPSGPKAAEIRMILERL